MATFARSALIILVCALAASASLAAEKTYDQRFNAPAGGRLRLDTHIGSVAVVGGDAREVVVHVEMMGSDDFLSHLHVSAVQDSAGVTVTGRAAHGNWFNWFGFEQHRVRFTIEVPRDYPVDIRTSGGSLDIRHLRASVSGETAGGSIQIRDVVGSIDTHTSGGSIRVADSTGDLDVHTFGGSIHLEGIDGAVTAATSGGSVNAEMRRNQGVSLVTSGGSITLHIPAGVHASVDAHTSGGRVESEIPLSSTEVAAHDELRGAINGGGKPIFLSASGGSIRIDRLD
jgi:Putative adhesin